MGEHLRQLLQETLVRVRIPVKKRPVMLHGNSFLQTLLEAHVQRLQSQQEAEEKPGGPPHRSDRHGTAPHAPPPSKEDAVTAAEEHFAHRVGRVVGILLKPSVASTLLSTEDHHSPRSTSGGHHPLPSTLPTMASANASGLQILPEAIYTHSTVWTSPTSWQVVVHFGERIDVMPLAAVSNTAMREDEHRVWVRTALFHASPAPHSSPTSDAAAAAASSLSTLPYVMTGEAGVLKNAQIQRLRHILQYLQLEEKTRQRLQAKECRVGGSASSHASERGNDEDEEEALEKLAKAFMKKEAEALMTSLHTSPGAPQEGGGDLSGVKEEEKEDDSDGEEEEMERAGSKRRRTPHDAVKPLVPLDTSSSSTMTTVEKDFAVQKQRLENLLAEKEMHVQQYRQLLSQKDRDLRNVLQHVQEADSEHAATLSQYEEKVRQGEQERMQLSRANEQASQQHATQLATASEKLLRMAQLAQKYKNVYEEAQLLATRWTAGGGGGARGGTEKKGGGADSERGDRHWTVDSVLQTLKQIP